MPTNPRRPGAIAEWSETIRSETLADSLDPSETGPAEGTRDVKTGAVTVQVWIITTE